MNLNIGNNMGAIRARRAIIQGQERPAVVVFDNGVVIDVLPYDAQLPCDLIRDCPDNEVLMGGLVDSHVHVNEPGREEWEGFATATSAAAAGGVTTIVDMPLNSSPVTTSHDNLLAKIEAMAGKCRVDVGLLGGIVPGNADQIERMVLEGGVVGFKSFLVHSGIDDFPAVSRSDVDIAMKVMRGLKDRNGSDVVMMFHAEVAEPIDAAVAAQPHDADPKEYSTFLASRPKASENQAIDLVIDLTRENGVRSHIVHLSSAEAVPALRDAMASGCDITAETTFHYLYFVAEHVPAKNTLYKCCPPIRESINRDALWQAVQEGIVNILISDHSPCTIPLKLLEDGDFMKAWGGISSMQLGLSIVWTEARKRGIPYTKLAEWMCDAPARLVNLNDRKGSIAVGRDADFVIWDPESQFVVDQATMFVKNRASPYHGFTLHGRVLQTILRGNIIYSHDQGHTPGTYIGQRLVPTSVHTSPSYPEPYLPPVERLNTLDDAQFISVVHLLFETAKPLESGLLAGRPYTSYESLVETAQSIIDKANEQDKLDIINAHPRIGGHVSTLSSQSLIEQGSEQDQVVLDQLATFNQEYHNKYNFNFVVHVQGRPKSDILPILKARLHNSDAATELATGLSEMIAIAQSRLVKLTSRNAA
eukprot:gene12060-14111_t